MILLTSTDPQANNASKKTTNPSTDRQANNASKKTTSPKTLHTSTDRQANNASQKTTNPSTDRQANNASKKTTSPKTKTIVGVDHMHPDDNLSEYEIRRQKRINENKRKFDEIFGTSTSEGGKTKKKKVETPKVRIYK